MEKGGILGKKTISELLENNSLKILKDDRFLKLKELTEDGLIDETSINLNIGRLYRLSPEVTSLDIKGKYVLGEDFQEIKPEADRSITIDPDDHLVGFTFEKLQLPENIVGKISERKTSVGNLGIEIEGYAPPGLSLDHVTFRLKNNTKRAFKIYIGDAPPMKIMFEFLSSLEAYGSEREAKVENTESIISGLGDPKYNATGQVEYSYFFDTYAVEGKKHNIKLIVKNNSTLIIRKLTVIPTIVIDKYRFTSFSNNWEFLSNSDGSACPQCNKNGCKHSVVYKSSILPSEVKEFNFEIVFLQAINPTTLKIAIECDIESEKVQIVDKTESNSLIVQSKTNYLLRNFGERFWDASLIALFVYCIDHGLAQIIHPYDIGLIVLISLTVLYQLYLNIFSRRSS